MALGSALISIMFYRMEAANKVNQNGFLDLRQVEVGRFFSPKAVKLHLLNCVLVEMRVCAINQWSALILAPLISPAQLTCYRASTTQRLFYDANIMNTVYVSQYVYLLTKSQTVKIDLKKKKKKKTTEDIF